MNNQIRWYNNLYFGEKAAEEGMHLKEMAVDGKPHKGLYLLTLPSNEKNLMDLFPHYNLFQTFYQEMEISVIGLAIGKGEAQALAAKIITQMYTKTGNTDLKAFLDAGFEEPEA